MIYTTTFCTPDPIGAATPGPLEEIASISNCGLDVIDSGIWRRQEEVWENIELFWGNWTINLGGENCG